MPKHGTALTLGQFAEFGGAVLKALPRDIDPDVALNWAKNGSALERVLREVLEPSAQQTPTTLKVWKTIKLGLRKSPGEYRQALLAGKFCIEDYANQILGKTPVSQEEVEVDLVLATDLQLGFKVNTRRDAIYERVSKLGLQRCPAEVGPALREQYKDQPMDEWVLIGMDPIPGSDGRLIVFTVGRGDNGLWLHGNNGSPGSVCNPGVKWVFVLPRPSTRA